MTTTIFLDLNIRFGDSAAPRQFADYKITVADSLPDGIIHRELSAANLAGVAFPFDAK
jgi:hypothetical protein